MSVGVDKTDIQPSEFTDHHNPSAPTIYADQIMGMTFGPFVCRLTFGLEDHPNKIRNSVATVVMPTNILHSVIIELAKQLGNENVRKTFDINYQAYLQSTKS